MSKLIKLFATVAIATAFAGTSRADVQSGLPVYVTIYYTDSTYETDVGIIQLQYCTYYNQTDGAQYGLTGIQTAFGVDNLAGYCFEGNYFPI